MKNSIMKLIQNFPALYAFVLLYRPSIGAVRGSLQGVHDKFRVTTRDNTIAVDLGCGPFPQNRFAAEHASGLDLVENNESNVLRCRLGFEPLPYADSSIDYLTAYDLLEHIPRYSDDNNIGNTPFIYLMNECFRVLKPGGVFLSMTPIYPYMGAFQDPTHNNIMTVDTFDRYFSVNKLSIAEHYGITTNFEVIYRKILGQHLVAVLKK